VKVLSTGATGRATIDLLGDPFGGLAAYLGTGADFSLNNPGAPIAYTARYLKDSQVASAALTTDYSETTSVWADDVARSGFEVYDNRDRGGPVNTGIPVAGGDEVTISASGQLWAGVWATGANGPEGWSDKAKGNFPLEGAAVFSLIAGYDNQGWFAVGRGTTKVREPKEAYAQGLTLALNDNNPYNGGTGPNDKFVVNVHVRRNRHEELKGVGSTVT
jgi:hypothetical protein